jgi:hypothetical protein
VGNTKGTGDAEVSDVLGRSNKSIWAELSAISDISDGANSAISPVRVMLESGNESATGSRLIGELEKLVESSMGSEREND